MNADYLSAEMRVQRSARDSAQSGQHRVLDQVVTTVSKGSPQVCLKADGTIYEREASRRFRCCRD